MQPETPRTQTAFPAACPVPPEQQPLNQYEELSESGFFQWPTLPLAAYSRKLLWVWGWGWVIAGPVAAASFPPGKHPLPFALVGIAGANLFVLFALVRLYLGWFYVRSRLVNTTIVYEESGWYDGQSWEKPPAVLAQDKLVMTYQVQPLLQRVRRSLALLALLWIIDGLLWWGLRSTF